MAKEKEKKQEPVEAEVVEEEKEYCCNRQYRHSRGRLFWGMILVAIGGILIAENFVNIDLWRYFWPLVLVVLGLSLIVRSVNY